MQRTVSTVLGAIRRNLKQEMPVPPFSPDRSEELRLSRLANEPISRKVVSIESFKRNAWK
jgi:hypothetical protein